MDVVGRVIGDVVSGMLGGLIKNIFQFILSVFDLLFRPLVALITVLFPDLSTFLSQMVVFLGSYIFPRCKFYNVAFI